MFFQTKMLRGKDGEKEFGAKAYNATPLHLAAGVLNHGFSLNPKRLYPVSMGQLRSE